VSREIVARRGTARKSGAPCVHQGAGDVPDEGAAKAGRAKPDRGLSAPIGGGGGAGPPRLDTSETSRHPANPFDPARWREVERARRRLAASMLLAARVHGRSLEVESQKLQRCGVVGTYTDEAGNPLMKRGRDGVDRPVAMRWWCRRRACPHCARRVSGERAAALAGHIMRRGLRPVFLTLTQKREPHESIGDATERMMSAWTRLQRHKVWKESVSGYVWKRESTWAQNKGHHVHLHLLIETHTRRDYAFTHRIGGKRGSIWYTDTSWIDVDALRVAWRRAAGTTAVNVDVAPVRAGVAEVTKYASKSADLLKMPPSVLGEWLLTWSRKRGMGCDRAGVFEGWSADLHERDGVDQERAAETEDDGQSEIVGWSLLDRRSVRRRDARLAWAGNPLPCGVEVREAWRMLSWWGWECARRCEVERPPAPQLCAPTETLSSR